ncbi:hypothetical protein GC170_20235 [bacterium]|nr:hypothetical protein [bacterium]
MSTRKPIDRARGLVSNSVDSPVAISGLGLVTSLGRNFSETFDNLCAGKSGLVESDSSRTRPDKASRLRSFGFPVDPSFQRVDDFWDDPVFAILAKSLEEAIEQARIDFSCFDPERIAVVVGLSKGAVRLKSHWSENRDSMSSHPLARTLGLAGVAPSSGASFVASKIGARGPVLAPITACATGLTCLRVAAGLLRDGSCDIAIAGAADASLTPMIEASFRRMKALATPLDESDPPEAWVRPWSANRNGFLIGEGGAIFVLERECDLKASGRCAVARITGCAAGSEAHHATRPHASPAVLERVIRETIGVHGKIPDAIHLHATGTRDFDALEATAIRQAIGPEHERIRMLASKSQIGHCLGAAGAVELAIACGSLFRGILPPFVPRPPFDFEHPGNPVGPESIATPTLSIMKLVAGFGGHIEACHLVAAAKSHS